MIIVLIWIFMGIAGTILRRDLREDSDVQGGLFPIFAWVGPMVGGIILGPLALLSAISQVRR